MTDPSMAEFTSRIARIEKARAKGFGFEAEGTLGRSFYSRRTRTRSFRLPLLRPMLTVLVLGVALKSVLIHELGADAYQTRVAGLLQGEGFDRIGGFLMQVDPLTGWTVRQIDAFSRLQRA